ncbi:MAG: polyamine aminopropyltransferase [Desulfobacteraceae bacterium]|nr:polyamine aminopropyltransferase [Desulfobacteraceae bacterium]
MTGDQAMDLWVREVHRGVVALSFKVEKTLFSGKSPYQQVDVIQTAGHGRMLLNDGIVMISERDEFVYHEMIAHVPLFVHPDPKRVLVIGGGDGGTVREVVRHPGVECVVMVEIDEMVVHACREHFPQVSSALDHPKLSLHIEDGVRFVAETKERFDVVIVDSTDPIGPAQPLFDKAFYENTAGLLLDGGILITQAESPFYDPDLQRPMLANQRPYFPRLHLYLLTNLTYPGGLWSFGFASKGPDPLRDFDPRRVEASGLRFRYYNADIHRAAFALPTFVTETLCDTIDAAGV